MKKLFYSFLNQRVTRLVRVKAYKPRNNLEDTIKLICSETIGKDFKEDGFKQISFNDPLIKFKVIIKIFFSFFAFAARNSILLFNRFHFLDFGKMH